MKAAEEIKKAMRCVAWDEVNCDECAYRHDDECNAVVGADALAYIRQLEEGIDRCYKLAKQLEAAHRPEYCEGADYDCKALGEARKRIAELEAQVPRWISVEERLPEVSDVVLVIANGKPREHITLINAFLIASFWGEEGWIADGFEGWDKLDVSYWMVLPEPPKEG